MAGPARFDVTAAAVSDPVFQVAHMSLAYPARRGQPAVPILTDVSFEVGRGAHADGSVWLGKIDPPPLPESPRGGDRGWRPFRRPRHHVARPTRAPAARGAGPPDARPLMTVGLVQLPGMMTGRILAGASPLVAIEYQIVVVFMLAVATSVASLLFVRLAVRRYLTPAHQLRRYLL